MSSPLSVSRLFGIVAVGLIGLVAASAPAAETFTFHHENVLGTSLELTIDAESQAAATEAEARVLVEIERLSAIFSTYDAKSEFSRWQRTAAGMTTPISRELFSVLEASERWNARSGGAFNPGAEVLTQTWTQAAAAGRLPTDAELAANVAQLKPAAWQLDLESSAATRLGSLPLSLNAIAKGSIIDGACRAALDPARGTIGVMVNIGGDLRAVGARSQQLHVSDPRHAAVNAQPLASICIRDQAVATSGGCFRGVEIAGKKYSHIFDPRTGRPTDHVLSATVVANSATDADALATIFNVLTIEESAALAKTLPGTEYLAVAADGRMHTSLGWSDLQQPRAAAGNATSESNPSTTLVLADAKAGDDAKAEDNTAAPVAAAAAAAGLLELVVDFELDRPSGAQYRRPYVAIWLEDKDEFPVRTAVLWMQTKEPGPRWHRDLLRWYRNDKIRKLADGTSLIGTVSSATRQAGKYQAVFDGKDDAGKALPPGEYTLLIEAAREHGTYQLIRKKVTLGAEPIGKTELKPNVEVKAAAFEYR